MMGGNSVSDRTGVTGFTQIMDNARLRAWRVVLEPGQATGETWGAGGSHSWQRRQGHGAL